MYTQHFKKKEKQKPSLCLHLRIYVTHACTCPPHTHMCILPCVCVHAGVLPCIGKSARKIRFLTWLWSHFICLFVARVCMWVCICFYSPWDGSQTHTAMPGFACGFWELNSGVHACSVNSLPAEPSSKPIISISSPPLLVSWVVGRKLISQKLFSYA